MSSFSICTALTARSLPARWLREPATRSERAVHPACWSIAPAPMRRTASRWADGYVDYLELVNARDGGINGVKITYEECETGYATDRGVECYERLKSKGPTGAAVFDPLSTGITFALTEKAPARQDPDHHHGLWPRGHRPTAACSPGIFPLLGTYWTAADVIMQHIANKLGGFEKLKGKKIALVYHDSPYGKEPIPLLEELPSSRLRFPSIAGHASGRRAESDLAADPPAASRLRVAVGLGRDELDRDQGGGRGRLSARPDVSACGGRAPSPTCCRREPARRATTPPRCTLRRPDFPVHKDIIKYVYDKGKGTGGTRTRSARCSTTAA